MGRNVKAIAMDEITSWDETLTQRGGWNVYHRLRKSTNRFGFDGHVYVISMVWAINDIIMTLIKTKDPKTLTKQYTTWEMNPNKALDSPEMKSEQDRDPISFWRDYGAQPHSSIESYYPDRAIVRMNEERINMLELAKNGIFLPSKATYILSADPSIRNDNFGLALLHFEDNKTICDGLLTLRPHGAREINPIEVRDLLMQICKHYRIAFFITDQWYYNEAILALKNIGIEVLFKPLRKEEHDAVKNAFFERTFELCNYPEILDEFSQLLVLDSKRIGIVRKGKIDTVDALTRGYWAVQNHLLTQSFPLIAVEILGE
jgi:hypothetical protein